jgi:hypothetical protein
LSKRVSELVVLAVSDESTTTIHAMLVLDSNQLRHVLPGNPALLMVKAAAHRGGHTLATTDIVLHEVLRWHREELHLKIKALRAAVREVNTLMPPGLTIPDPPGGVLLAMSISFGPTFFSDLAPPGSGRVAGVLL